MIAESNGLLKPATGAGKPSQRWYLLSAIGFSIGLHGLIAYHWHSPSPDPLQAKPPEIVEVELVTPPEIKKIEPPKPVAKPKAPEKPKIKPAPLPKPKPKPTPPPKPVEAKTPPKVVQKTFTEAAPEVKASKPAYTPVPVMGIPKTKPSPVTAPSAAKAPPKPAAGTPPSGAGGNSEVQVLQRTEPSYPQRALSRHLQGKVTVQFTVNTAGHADNPSVVSASPPGVFEEAALAAIARWRFKPKMVNGKPVSQRSVQTINFILK